MTTFLHDPLEGPPPTPKPPVGSQSWQIDEPVYSRQTRILFTTCFVILAVVIVLCLVGPTLIDMAQIQAVQ